jgi:ABC-type sugar transport system substrate-binding protein
VACRGATAATVLAAFLTLGGCGRHGDGPATVTEASRNPPLVGVSFDAGNEIRRAELRGLQDGAAMRGAGLRVRTASNDPVTQHLQIAQMLADGVDALIVIAQDRDAIATSVQDATAQHVPFIALDRAPTPTVRVAATVTGDPRADGAAAARALAALGRPLRTLHLIGDLADANATGRRDGFDEEAAKRSMDVVARAETGWVPARARRATLRALRRDRRIDAIFVPSDFLLPAVIDALRTVRRLHRAGDPGHVAIVTVDGDPVGCTALRGGYIDADVATPIPELARRALDAAIVAAKRPTAPPLRVRLRGFTLRRGSLPRDAARVWGCRAA